MVMEDKGRGQGCEGQWGGGGQGEGIVKICKIPTLEPRRIYLKV